MIYFGVVGLSFLFSIMLGQWCQWTRPSVDSVHIAILLCTHLAVYVRVLERLQVHLMEGLFPDSTVSRILGTAAAERDLLAIM